MRIFEPTSTLLPQDAIQDMQYRGCANDSCYLHPYDADHPLWFQFPIKIDLQNSNVLFVGTDGIPFTGFPLDNILPQNFVVGTYKCGGEELNYTTLTGIDMPNDRCYFMYFVLRELVTGSTYYYATEFIKPVVISDCQSWVTIATNKNSPCGACDSRYYGKAFSVIDGNANLQLFNTITIWGDIARLADSKKYELNASTNKKKSTTTFERWRIGSSVLVPNWVMESIQSVFDGLDFVVVKNNEQQYFDHSDDDPFKSLDVPCVCFKEFATILEKEACQSGVYCASDGQIGGCTSICYQNYNPLATYDDGSCENVPCDALVIIGINDSLAYWQGVQNNLLLPDGVYIFAPNFFFDSLCNCANEVQKGSIHLTILPLANIPFIQITGGVVSFQNPSPYFAEFQSTYPLCSVNLRPVNPFSNADYFGVILNGTSIVYDFEINPNGLQTPVISASTICQ